VIAAVNGVVLDAVSAGIVLEALEAQVDRSDMRVLALYLRRSLSKSGVSRRISPLDTRSGASTASNPTLQPEPEQHPGRATLSSSEAAAILGVTPNNIRDLRRRGRLPATLIGSRWHFDPRVVDARLRSTIKE